MGQENMPEQHSLDAPIHTLNSRTIEGAAEFIKDGKAKKIVVMTGAGISTSAGIPDFRSPETGLYANLARLNLPYAEAVFDIDYFEEHPEPFYVLAKELYPGKFFPTLAHSFVALLDRKSMLEMCFTQNIDCLERKAGVPASKIVEAHGSFATQRCIDCKTEIPDEMMMKAVSSGEVPHCMVPQCNGLVKPDIVFFGEPLPPKFAENRPLVFTADLVIVMGTSLSVYPFAGLPQLVREGVPRVLINKEEVGDFGSRPNDVIILDECDEGVRKLADALGWRDELESLWSEVKGVKEAEKLPGATLQDMTNDERVIDGVSVRDRLLDDEIAKLNKEIDQMTKEVDDVLHLPKTPSESTDKLLEKPASNGQPNEEVPEPVLNVNPTKTETQADENAPFNKEKTTSEQPASASKTEIKDATLPQNKQSDRSTQ